MSLDVIHKIIEDLKLVSSLVPGGNEERKLAQERLDAIKGSPACLDIAQELIRYRSTPISLFYGLDLLMHCATTLQLSSANILSCLSLLHQQDPSYIKEKMAKVIVEFVKRVWPGAWSDFDAVFRAFYASEVCSIRPHCLGFWQRNRAAGVPKPGAGRVCVCRSRGQQEKAGALHESVGTAATAADGVGSVRRCCLPQRVDNQAKVVDRGCIQD